MDELFKNKELTEVWLNFSKVNDREIRGLKNLTELSYLTLAGNPDITDEGILILEQLTKMESLSLIGTSITDAGLQALSAYRKLENFNTPEFSEERVEWLAQQMSLKHLAVGNFGGKSRYTTLTPEEVGRAVEQLKAIRPDIDVTH